MSSDRSSSTCTAMGQLFPTLWTATGNMWGQEAGRWQHTAFNVVSPSGSWHSWHTDQGWGAPCSHASPAGSRGQVQHASGGKKHTQPEDSTRSSTGQSTARSLLQHLLHPPPARRQPHWWLPAGKPSCPPGEVKRWAISLSLPSWAPGACVFKAKARHGQVLFCTLKNTMSFG